VAGLAVAVEGWALAAMLLAANNRIRKLCFISLYNSRCFLWEVYQMLRQPRTASKTPHNPENRPKRPSFTLKIALAERRTGDSMPDGWPE
jgi:hypothetical protein